MTQRLTALATVTFIALLGGATATHAQTPTAPAIKDCPDCPELAAVPAGTFKMGSDSKSAMANEKPTHAVTFAKGFAIGKYEVTFAEWDACVADKGCTYSPSDQGWGKGKQPVTNVSFEDIQQYIAWLSKKTGKAYRLPSEAEWEYAARAGTTTDYPWGDDVGKDNANCMKCVDKAPEKPVAVGSYKPNAFGLFDVAGNLTEWVADCYEYTYEGAPKDGAARKGNQNCQIRTTRGGSWHDEPKDTRVSARDWFYPYNRFAYLGFRVARNAE